MSDYIKKLAEQAGMEWETQSWCWLANPPHLEKFAELVRQDYLRELKALKPVAWKSKNRGLYTVEPPASLMPIPLYALDEVKHD